VSGHEPLGETGYLAAAGFADEVRAELGTVSAVHDRLIFAPGPPRLAAWAQNIWLDPVRIAIASVSDGVRALRGIQRNWALYSTGLHRRARLIQDGLPKISGRPLVFPAPLPRATMGPWTLLDAGAIVASARCSNPFPHGEMAFAENRHAPPNRAYLKLWELFTLIERRPAPGERCLDLGACPGGWSWVLHELGAHVVAVDKAPLAPAIAALPRIEFRRASAFGLDPATVGPVDWLFCDVICYPQRLWDLVQLWLMTGLARRMVCSIKFQGATDMDIQRRFAAVPGARLMHLHHNKHELTWLWSDRPL